MKTQYCPKCRETNPISEFSINKLRKNGLYFWCKKCVKDYNKEYRENNKEKIKRQKKEQYEKFPWKRTLVSIKQRCDNPKNNRYYRYGNRDIECRITEEELKKLWKRDKTYLMDKPSIDREDNDGHYEYDNCRFIELGRNTGKDKRKFILQFDLNGTFIREWKSLTKASKTLNIVCSNICNVVLGKRKTAGGFIWRYKDV